MGLIELLGGQTPSYLNDNRMKLAQFGLGMMGQEGIGGAVRGGIAGGLQGQQMDQQRQLQQQEEQQRLDAINQANQQKNYTLEYLQKQGRPDLVAAMQGGMSGGDAWKQFLQPQGPKPTSDMQEYEFARSQGFKGSFTDFMQQMRKAGATTVNVGQGEVGTIPQGFELFTDPESGARSMRPISGGPAAIEAQKAEQAAQTKKETTDRSANVVVQDIDRALDQIEGNGFFTTGAVGAATQGIPSMPAHNVSQLIQTVQANTGFDRLQAMRDSSPTGGALGAINQTEMALLQSALGNLNLSQDGQQLTDNLKRVKNIYLDIIHGPNAGPQREQLSFEAEQGGTGKTKSGITWSLE